MSKSKWLAFVTPKTFINIDMSKFPEDIRNDIEVISTKDIYLNLMDPDCTEEMCDNTCYICEREYFEKLNKSIFQLKDY